MAMSSHSPSMPYNGPGSPPRALAGYHEQPNAYPPMYGPQPRPMPPPSPQHYPRYAPQPPPPPPIQHSTPYGQHAPHKRPGSSMSISSMLGGPEPERPHHDSLFNHVRSSSHGQPPLNHGPPTALGAIMSPPQYPPRSNPQDYAYKPRATTPDRVQDQFQNRYRSGSGSLLQRPGPFEDHAAAFNRFPPSHPDPVGHMMSARDDTVDRARRTSLSGILQRPESAPQRVDTNGPMRLPRPESAAPISTNGDVFPPRNPPPERQPPLGTTYDTRPPPFNTRPPPPPARPYEKRDTLSRSPELRRTIPNGVENRSFNGILNDTPPISHSMAAAQNMARQDSVQSQTSTLGGYRPRAFSPFAPSVTSQTSMPVDEYGRKGSDELGHRTILGLANESRRGRYSPVPQAVQGAQAPTPVPDSGSKAEQGRVFAGLGGGLGSGPTSTPVGLSASPFKEASARLSEENLMKMSRSTSGMGKRSRKFDESIRAESEAGDGKKGRKRSKYAHAYKPEDLPRRGTPLSVPPQRNPSTLSNHQPVDPRPVFKPRQTIKLMSVINAAKRNKRRHLGTFRYDAKVSNTDRPKSTSSDRFEVDLTPTTMPSFDQPEHINCTYTVRVPRLWLQERERRMIAKGRFLWGSGIYTDDSDIIAVAMHSGFLKSVPPENADKALLDLIAKEQNAKIEGMEGVPAQPVVPEPGKDAVFTCVVLPCLEEYQSSTRFGIKSRQWPDEDAGTKHDGVSFAIIKLEFVNDCIEARRVGRTGKERRERLQKEMEERRRGKEKVKQIAEKLKKRVRKVGKVQRSRNGETLRKELAGKAAMNSLKEKMRLEEEKRKEKEKENVATTAVPPATNGALDVGQTPGEWLKQLETSAVDEA